MAEVSCDLLVIGAGPGGYVAAIRAAQMGNKVVIVEKENWGGVCLNCGCIPTKTLLFASEIFSLIETAREYGIDLEKKGFSLERLRQKKDRVVNQLVRGVEFLLKANNCIAIKGTAKFLSPRTVEVLENSGARSVITAQNTIIATGTEPITLPHLPVDGDMVVDSKAALELKRIPQKIAVIGAGAIGIEFADIYRALGSQVVVIEMLDQILPTVDTEIVTTLATLLKRHGIEIYTGHKVTQARTDRQTVTLTVEPVATGQAFFVSCDMVLVAVGLRGRSNGIGLDTIGVFRDQKGFIKVNEQMQTNIPGIYAIGDVAGGKLLAHKASHEGMVAAEAVSGHKVTMDYRVVPYAIFTDPEIGSVGLTEQEAIQQGHNIKIGRFPFRALGKAVAISRTEGLVKIIGDARTDELLGLHILGPHAGDLIAEGALAMSMTATCEDLTATIHVHPTLPEAILEAGLDVGKKAIHLVSKK